MSLTLATPGTRAVLKSYRMSASKVREVLDLIRGKDIIAARDILIYSDRGSAKVILKLLASAVANAENNDSIPADELFVAACFADEGPTLKRFKPRARGRASQILKRTSHITIYVARMEPSRIGEIARKRNVEDARRAERRSARVRKSTSSLPEDPSVIDMPDDAMFEEVVNVVEVVEPVLADETDGGVVAETQDNEETPAEILDDDETTVVAPESEKK